MMAFKFDKQTFKQEFKKKFLVRRFKVSSVATILTILLTIVATLCFQFVNVKTSLKWPLCTSNQRISRRILSYQPLNSSKTWNILKMKLLSFHTTVVTLKSLDLHLLRSIFGQPYGNEIIVIEKLVSSVFNSSLY